MNKTLKQFANSKNTKKQIKKALLLSEKAIQRLKEARNIDDWILNTPITI